MAQRESNATELAPSTATANDKERTTSDLLIDLEDMSIYPPSRPGPIVYRFNLKVRRGSLVALMGGSGCGKTTLMVYLTRRMKSPYGDWGITAKKHVHPKRVEFVAQKEMFFPYDTPERHLLFLRQRRFFETFEKSREAVVSALNLVGLTDESKWYAQIGEGGRDSTLSGGERRLLTVASALIVEPEMVILDEPTSGMDSYTALHICHQLKLIAEKNGTTFVVSIHQPSEKVLAEFDFVERMKPPTGPFRRGEPIAEGHVDNNLPVVDASHTTRELTSPELRTVSSLGQLQHLAYLYLYRSFIRCWTNWRAGPLRLAASLAFAIMCGVAWINLDFTNGDYLRDILGACLALIGLSFAPIILNATLFASERDVLLEEHVHLSYQALLCDMTGRFVADIFLGAAAAAVLLVGAGMVGYHYIGWYFLTMWMQAWAADSFGLFISMVAPPHIAIGIVIPTVGFLSVALGTGLMQPAIANEGYIFHVSKWLSFFKYGFQALLIKELPRTTIPCTKNCLLSTGEQMLDQLHLTGDGYEVSMGFQYLMLFVFTLLLRTLATFILRQLILAGNRRYSYDNSGNASAFAAVAGPAPSQQEHQAQEGTPAQGNATPPLSPALHPEDPEDHEPVEELDASVREAAAAANANGLRVWKLSKIRLDPSPIDAVLKRASGYREDPAAARRVVLDVPEFSIHPRETVAIIGPTGSGKSLMLRALGNRIGDGVVAEEPTRFYSTCSLCRPATVQFVDGSDETLPNLRAIEPVAFHAGLYDADSDEQAIKAAAATQLLALGIHAEKHKNYAFTLSGGQLRRLSVACKTVMHPAVLLIDEPTSGLDHDAALNLGRHLRNMAAADGVAVVCSLQQPDTELLKCFDSFVFLRDGRIVVRGSEAECRAHLRIKPESTCWAEDALNALAKDCVTCTGDEAKIHEAPAPAPIEVAASNSVNIFHDPRRSLLVCIKELTHRNFLNRWARAPTQTLGAFLIRYLLLPIILSVLLVNIGKKDPAYFSRSGLIFVYAACTCFSSMLNGAVNFPVQRKMVEDEINANLYTTTAYLLSSWYTTAFAEDVIGSVLGSIAIKYIASLDANLGVIIATTIVTSQVCDSIGYLCGLFRNLPVASGITVLVLMPFMIGANVIATTEQVTRMPILYVLEVLSTVRYSYLIVFRSELEESLHSTVAADAVFQQYGLTSSNKWFQQETLWPVFVCYAVLMRFICLLVYKRMVCPPCRAGQ